VGIGLGGYLAYKWLGARAGLLLAGVLGGAVSSTATTVSYSRRARASGNGNGVVMTAAVVIVVASTVAYARVLTEIAAVAPTHAFTIGEPVAALGVFSAVVAIGAWVFCRKDAGQMPEQENPAELKSAIYFAILYAVVLLAVSAAKQYLDQRGLFVVAAVSGLTDMDAITLSVSRLAQEGRMSPETAWRAIIIASMSNQVFKLGIVGVMGGARLMRVVAIMFGVQIAAGVGVLVWW
jgi:uncharacterized membrane protein (DUF4010 family)